MNPAWHDPILTCAEAKAFEARLFGDDEAKEWPAMQRAGAAVAQAAIEDFKEIGGFPAAGRVLVLAGKGHNGGDALIAAQAILARHPAARADVVFVFGERALRPLARRAWRDLSHAAGNRVKTLSVREDGRRDGGQAAHYDLCLDGIFGFQFRPPVDAATAEVLRRINAHKGIRLRAAVDLPSGVGEKAGAVAFRADFTYATGIVKEPALAEEHRDRVGRLRYLDLGFFDDVGSALPAGRARDTARKSPASSAAAARASGLPTEAPSRVLKPSILAPLAALRDPQSDKRTFGHLFVLGGSSSYPGAVLMCAQAALRSGAGLVTAFVPESLAPAYAARVPEAIWVGWPETPEGGLALDGLVELRSRLERATALAMGPGLGAERETRLLAAEVVKLTGVPVVLDADALQPAILAAAKNKRVVCTPHAGEFMRLAGAKDASPDTLRALAQKTGATIVLKGSLTRVAAGDGVYHSLFGGPVLARGGSGDVLAGLIGGLLAQSPDDPALAACRGVVWHGLAADLLARERGQVAAQTTQLIDHLPAALLRAT